MKSATGEIYENARTSNMITIGPNIVALYQEHLILLAPSNQAKPNVHQQHRLYNKVT